MTAPPVRVDGQARLSAAREGRGEHPGTSAISGVHRLAIIRRSPGNGWSDAGAEDVCGPATPWLKVPLKEHPMTHLRIEPIIVGGAKLSLL
jgi:hypothetical protein